MKFFSVLFVAVAALVGGSSAALECEVFQETDFYIQLLDAKLSCQRSPFLILSPSYDAYENLCVLEKLGILEPKEKHSQIVINWLALEAFFVSSELEELSATCAFVLPEELVIIEGEEKRFLFDSCHYHELDSVFGDLFMCSVDQVKITCSEDIIIDLLPIPNPDGICYTPTDAYTFSMYEIELTAEMTAFVEGDIAGESLDIVAGITVEMMASFEAIGITKPSQLLIKMHEFCNRGLFIEWLKEYILINEIDANDIFWALINWCSEHEFQCFDIIIDGGSGESSSSGSKESGSKSCSKSKSCSGSSEEIECANIVTFESSLTAAVAFCTPEGNPKTKPFNSLTKKKPKFYDNPTLCALNQMGLIHVAEYAHVSFEFSLFMSTLGCSAGFLAEITVTGMSVVFTPLQYLQFNGYLETFLVNVETVCAAV